MKRMECGGLPPHSGGGMKKLITILLFTTACAHITSDIQPGSAEPAVRRMAREFGDAANSGNIDGMMAIYANDAVLLPPGAPEMRGRAAIRQFWSGLVAAKPHVTLNTQQVIESGDMATEIGTYELIIGGKTETGKYALTWRRANGEWRAIVDIFNSNGP